MTLSRSCVLVLVLAAACGGGDGGEQPGGDGGHSSGDADAAPGGGAPGEIDTSFGAGGTLETDWRIESVFARDTGEALLATTEYPALVTPQGALAAVDDVWVSSHLAAAAPDEDGAWIVLHADPYEPLYTRLVRLTSTLAVDDGFDGTGHFEDFGTVGMTRAGDGSFFLLGWRNDEQIVVRKLDAAAARVEDYGPEEAGEAATSIDLEIDYPVDLAATSTGAVVVLAGDVFQPALVRFTEAGELDADFGGGVIVLDSFGPRYGRAIAIDEQDRVLVLGMENSAIQIGRVLPDGTLDPAFGDAGMARLDITMPLSSEYDEHVEAQAMALQPDGAIVVAASYEYDLGEDDVLEEQSLLVARFLPDGAIDASFGDGGSVRVALDVAGTPANLAYRDGLAIAGDRILIAGHVVRDGQEQGAIRALHR